MQKAVPGVDKTFFKASKLEEQGNSDYQYWFDKSVKERLAAAAIMIAASFREPGFMNKKLDRTIFSARKQNA
jgi:hypothetical protein